MSPALAQNDNFVGGEQDDVSSIEDEEKEEVGPLANRHKTKPPNAPSQHRARREHHQTSNLHSLRQTTAMVPSGSHSVTSSDIADGGIVVARNDSSLEEISQNLYSLFLNNAINCSVAYSLFLSHETPTWSVEDSVELVSLMCTIVHVSFNCALHDVYTVMLTNCRCCVVLYA